MTRRSTFYGFIAAATATVAAGLVYFGARSRLAAFRDVGESNPQEARSVLAATDVSLLILIVASILTVILFLRYMTLRRREARQVLA
jgi:hypothetical protein